MTLLPDGVAIDTGAGNGFGRECSLAHAAEIARAVVVDDSNHEAAKETARQCELISVNPDFKSLVVVVDVSDPSSVEKMVLKAVELFGRIDYCINGTKVGVRKHVPVDDTDPGEMDRFWKVNVLGSFNCIKAVTKVMKDQSIINITSCRRTLQVGRGFISNIGSCNSYTATPHTV